jgi:hypothetical protein
MTRRKSVYIRNKLKPTQKWDFFSKIYAVWLVFICVCFLIILVYYIYTELQYQKTFIQNLLIEMRHLNDVILDLKSTQKETVNFSKTVGTNPNSDFYRDLLGYAFYSFAFISVSYLVYSGSSLFFTNYIETNSLFLLIKKANVVAESLLNAIGSTTELGTIPPPNEISSCYVFIDKSTDCMIKFIPGPNSVDGMLPGLYLKSPGSDSYSTLAFFMEKYRISQIGAEAIAADSAQIMENVVGLTFS